MFDAYDQYEGHDHVDTTDDDIDEVLEQELGLENSY